MDKIKLFENRYQDNITLYNMAVGFVLDNGFETVKNMTREEFDAAVNKERNFFGSAATALYDAAKDIVENCTPLVLCAIVGHHSESVYLETVYGHGVMRAEACCPNCGQSYFATDKPTGLPRCCKCGHIIEGPEALDRQLGGKKATLVLGDARRAWELAGIIDFVVDMQDDLDTSTSTAVKQLKSLWAAHCLRHGLEPDTAQYDSDLAAVWGKITEVCSDGTAWGWNYHDFDLYMGETLV